MTAPSLQLTLRLRQMLLLSPSLCMPSALTLAGLHGLPDVTQTSFLRALGLVAHDGCQVCRPIGSHLPSPRVYDWNSHLAGG